MKISRVFKNSIAEQEGFRKGDVLYKINGKRVHDVIDYKYLSADDVLNVEVERNGVLYTTTIEKNPSQDIGITFYKDNYRRCNNKCIFCFIDQNPPGLRKSLYFKDEDYRLSFLYGNYITLSNLTEKDIKRTIKLKLSPLYVSIHAIDKKIRNMMLGRKKDDFFLRKMKKLLNGGITLHGQIVLCPGINDGKVLEKTVFALAEFFPKLRTIAVVPVGLTKHRENLPDLTRVTKNHAQNIIRKVTQWQKEIRKKTGDNFIYLSDEFYLLAGEKLPEYSDYGDFWQIENGVGMVRNLLRIFEDEKTDFLEILPERKKVLFLTGTLFYPVLVKNIVPVLNGIKNLTIDVRDVSNSLFGEMVTVSGLLSGNDIQKTIEKEPGAYDLIVLPPDCINDNNVFPDNISLAYLNKKYNNNIMVFNNSFTSIITILKRK